jgi:phosphate transport system substrate-binding protein
MRTSASLSPRRSVGRLATAFIALWIVASSVAPASAAGPTVTGAGSTWVQIALEQWRADAARFGLTINYQGVGSAAGRQFFIIDQTDFAATEIPFEPNEIEQLEQKGKSYQYIPDVAGGTALMYNLKDGSGARVTNLGLSPATAAGIFTGKIQYWDDPAIRKDNAGRVFPHQVITPVVRSDGSGTSAKLADYFYHLTPSIFRPFMAANGLGLPVQYWPTLPHSVAQRSSDGVANFVASDAVGSGSIGYVEAGYALQRSFPVAGMLNKAGKYSLPSSTNIAQALTHATLNRDRTQNLLGVYNAPEPNSYPLASYSYLITETTGFDPAKGEVLGKWLIYIACAGQQSAAPLGYSPLPKNLIEHVFDGVRRIPGAPDPPAITASTCPNPTVTGKGFGGGGYADYVTPGGGSGGTGPGAGPTGTGGTGGTGDPTGGTGGTAGIGTDLIPGLGGLTGLDPSTIATLSEQERLYRYKQGLLLVGAATADQGAPLWIAPFAIAFLLLVPTVKRLKARRRSAM